MPVVTPAYVKTKIIATVGPASGTKEKLKALIDAGADVFRLNFAHGSYDWYHQIITWTREITAETGKPIALLGDLSGPKIRLGELPSEGMRCRFGAHVEFVRTPDPNDPTKLTCTYTSLIDDLRQGDRVLLADGTVSLRVIEQDPVAGRVVCEVVQPGLIRSKQGVNLPGANLSTPSVTEKDKRDLAFALDHEIDYLGLSFVRKADDVIHLRELIHAAKPKTIPWIVAKIEKTEAIDDLQRIVEEADAVMVARGDLGVEADIAHVPILQKQIIRLCNEHRVPVITATQMLDSMQKNELPTRAEVTDIANAVLDGTDAVMLSGETAAGDYPVEAVRMMNRVASEAERLLEPRPRGDVRSSNKTRATAITEAITQGAGAAADAVEADLIVVATRGGKTAMALSRQRRRMPILALTDRPHVARRMCLYWGVTSVTSNAVSLLPHEQLAFAEELGRKQGFLTSGSKLVLVGNTRWDLEWHDMCLVHVVP